MPLNNLKGTMTKSFIISSLAILSLAGCAAGPESVTTEHKGKVTLVHHRRRTSSGLVDKIEAISAKGVVTQAEIHVYDIGRLPHGDNGIGEAHRYYRVVQSEHPNLICQKGHRTAALRWRANLDPPETGRHELAKQLRHDKRSLSAR
jgi:hypothetical protein